MDTTTHALVDAIIKAAKEVHDTLGDGFMEQVYEEALFHELALRGIPSERQYNIDVVYKGIVLDKKYIPDLYVDETVLVELKSVKDLTTIDDSQLMNYLKITNLRVGLLMNFGSKLSVKRRIFEKGTGKPPQGTKADPEKLKKGNNPEPM